MQAELQIMTLYANKVIFRNMCLGCYKMLIQNKIVRGPLFRKVDFESKGQRCKSLRACHVKFSFYSRLFVGRKSRVSS